ncbi:MAG: 50S ribosomal protein L31 [Candidatus Nealsonbacteria bacterium CG23_combo_of_CG06-09_8_20_14_all_40_13]|uniref:Large ribosomal subunit protein bL31 n=1 Tax=Candidatus Nealsonbacteria bacterium CG23_combo_of_CG06-09_8_20_14_all_40_13 TaxID=1974724 RepID=A0A2G9YQK3_9BACT|nr:MAG: 50S ribosomal protein L31 [Candidatus Nealsonbacteria bacterium CG23_combo_of_CG06-09_8_20_14_all_40_13]PIR70759.1 MAG: 50S ribosomal protein L31 [Candidatus Nealsonbacteria bacterium CG10_big_fil_rev_8_21_14_0_10_40_24]PIU43617.1 MAG: 50S ribosomal protein L31 [Candidatus Nealsonbacteria bacterium CG07_land_8_20_14_0_80_40_10]
MKKNIHPAYHKQATIHCACGNIITVGSTAKKMQVEICSACHPLYTGSAKFVDTAGRVEKFKSRLEKSEKFKVKGLKKNGDSKSSATIGRS